jgi:hypothetical protein
MKRLFLSIPVMVLFLGAGMIYGQSSTNYNIEVDVISSGGGIGSSNNYGLIPVIGQSSAIGTSSSTDYINQAGFWYAVTANFTQIRPGDCNGDGQTTIDEVQRAINQFLGISGVEPCCDLNGNGQVTIDELQKVINAFLGI